MNSISEKSAGENRVWAVNVATCFLHFTSAIAVIGLWTDWPVPVTTSYISWQLKNETSTDGCAENNCEVSMKFATFGKTEISLLGLVLAFHFLSFSWQFLVLFPGPIQDRYYEGLANGTNAFRWIEYALSAPLMIVVIAAALGQVDVVVYYLLMVNTSMLMGLGYLQEVHMRETTVPHMMGWVLFAATWVAPTFTFFTSLSQSAQKPPDDILFIVYLTLFIQISLFGCFGIVQIVHVGQYHSTIFNCLCNIGGRKRAPIYICRPDKHDIHRPDIHMGEIKVHFTPQPGYYGIELAYGILSATAKVSLAVLLILLIRTRNKTLNLEFV